MFELSVALKYLLPRRRQLSVSIISLISVFVIALVVWLIVIFFSVSNGLEKHWVSRLIALTSPIRITPTDAYYDSYYYQIDSISDASNYTHKSIGEKLQSEVSDPYDPYLDAEVPSNWLPPHLSSNDELVDPVKELFASIDELKHDFQGLYGTDYENAFASIRLKLLRRADGSHGLDFANQTYLSQGVLVSSLDIENQALKHSLLEPTSEDVLNLITMSALRAGNAQTNAKDQYRPLNPHELPSEIDLLKNQFTLQSVRFYRDRWILMPAQFAKQVLREVDELEALAFFDKDRLIQVLVPSKKEIFLELISQAQLSGFNAKPVTIFEKKGEVHIEGAGAIGGQVPVVLLNDHSLPARLDRQADTDGMPRVLATLAIQDETLKIYLPLDAIEIKGFESNPISALTEASYSEKGEGIFLPRPFRDAGIRAGDRGYLAYQSASTTSVQEQRIPVSVKGFYDPGMIPIGGKLVLANRDVTSLIHAAHSQSGSKDGLGNGVHVNFANLDDAEQVKESIEQKLREKGIDTYWQVDTFRNYEFTRDFLQQMKSDKNLFLLIATIIIIVACSNIISMLIILVNDKKVEIGILRSMGASGRSIATIFGTCGLIMGLLGSAVGIAVAVFTLQNLDTLIGLISFAQGHEMFNPTFYGKTLPKELSGEALTFVLIATSFLSLIAGIVPAIKASRMKPSAILRSE